MEWIKTKLISSIQEAPSEELLADYLLATGRRLLEYSGKKDEHTVKTLLECAYSVLQEQEQPFVLGLSKPAFDKFKWFCLSSGLHIIAAPSGHGKTLWAMQYAQQAAQLGLTTSFLSLEMTHEDLGARMVAELTQLPLSDVARGNLTQNQKKVVEGILQENAYLNFIRVDKFDSLDWTKIEPRLWEHFLKNKPKLVVVDFVQMIYDSSTDDSRTSAQLANISRRLKLFADQTKSAVLLLSQMNREALREAERGGWSGEVPLSHSQIKESGGIVEAADSVQIVCIPQRFSKCPDDMRNKFQVQVDKNRKFGNVGLTLLDFNPDCGRFGK